MYAPIFFCNKYFYAIVFNNHEYTEADEIGTPDLDLSIIMKNAITGPNTP